MHNHGYYMQIPGNLSRRGVLDIGLKCPSSCLHCFTREPEREAEGKDFERNNKAPWRPTEQMIKQIELMKENGFLAFDVTGGEGTLHPGIVDIIARATEIGLSSRIITLGQFLDRKDLLNRLLDAGLSDMRFSYHSCDPVLFEKMTGGRLEKIEAAMFALDAVDFEYMTNTTITSANFRTLPEIARKLVQHRIYRADLLFMMSHYAWAESADKELRARYSEVTPYLREAVNILEGEGRAVTIRYAPLCTIAGLERNYVGSVGVRHDCHEWFNTVEHSGPGDAYRESKMISMGPREPPPGSWIMAQSQTGPFLGRGDGRGFSKVFGTECQTCSALTVCDGIDKGYLDKHGETELTAYYFDGRGSVIDRDRLTYLAGHVAKLTPDGKPSKAIRRLLNPQPPEIKTVSVVIANYNHATEIGKCIQSLKAQTWPGNIEIIVVDDSSTDRSWEVISEYEGITALRMTCDTNSGGPAEPRNFGLQISDGDVMAILDPDDWLEPTCIAEVVNMLQKTPAASIVYFGLDTFGTEEVRCVAPPFNAEQEIQQNYIACMSFFRREVFEDVGGYDDAEILHGVEDWNFWVSAIRLGHQAVALPRQLGHYCRSETGLFESMVKPNFEEKRNEVYRRNQEIYSVEFLDAHLKECGIVG